LRPANGAPSSREASAPGSQATQPAPPPRRSTSAAGSVSASHESSAAARSEDEDAAAPRMAVARVPLPPSRPGTSPASAAAAAAAPGDGGEDSMKKNSLPPVPCRVRLSVVEEMSPAGAEPGALVPWTPSHAPSRLGECRLRALYAAILVPKQGPAWQRWLKRHPVQYQRLSGVATDLPALLEAGDTPWSTQPRACPTLWTELPPTTFRPSWRGSGRAPLLRPWARGTLTSTTRTLAPSAGCGGRRGSWCGFLKWRAPMSMPRRGGPTMSGHRRGGRRWRCPSGSPQGCPASWPTLAQRCVGGSPPWRRTSSLEVAGVWYASARTKGYLWHLPASLVDSLVGLRLENVAKGAGPDATAYLSELLDLHQSLDWGAAGPFLAHRVGGEEGEAPRAFVHCDKRLVGGRIGLHEGLGDPAYR